MSTVDAERRGPYIGSMMRTTVNWVMDRIYDHVAATGFDDLGRAHVRLFRYPTADDPCILVSDAAGRLDAFSQVCTHLSCAIVHRPDEQALACPCHKGSFSSTDGRPLAGPPTRRLPRIVIERRGGDILATGIEV